MKSLKTLLMVIGIGVLLAATPAFGTYSLTMTVTVPYSFQAGPHMLPAGTDLVRQDMTSGALWLYNDDARRAMVVVTGVLLPSGNPDKAEARFRVYAGKHYPASIWSPLSRSGRELIPSRAEREAAKAGVPYKVAVLRVERY